MMPRKRAANCSCNSSAAPVSLGRPAPSSCFERSEEMSGPPWKTPGLGNLFRSFSGFPHMATSLDAISTAKCRSVIVCTGDRELAENSAEIYSKSNSPHSEGCIFNSSTSSATIPVALLLQ